MHKLGLLLAATAAITSCATPEPPAQRSAQMQQTYERLIAGKAGGPAQTCLPLHRTNDMTVIDEQTLVFRDGRTTWVNTMNGTCSSLHRVGHAIVNRTFGAQLCSGEIAQVVDTSSGMTVGSCAYGDFVPYRPAGG